MSKVIKSYQAFRAAFNELFKKYHPDNKETGHAEKFMKYHQAYEELKANGIADKLAEETISITTTQAYTGCLVKCKNFTLSIPPKFYYSKDTRIIKDKKGDFHKIYIKIIPEDDEIISFNNKFSDLMITKQVKVNIFDVVKKKKKELEILGEKIILEVKPNELLMRKSFTINDKGFPQRHNLSKRNPLTIQFKFVKIDLNDRDLSVINKMREHYGIN